MIRERLFIIMIGEYIIFYSTQLTATIHSHDQSLKFNIFLLPSKVHIIPKTGYIPTTTYIISFITI